MSDLNLEHYAANIRTHVLAAYAQNGPDKGRAMLRAHLRELGEVLAEVEGRERAVVMLDDVANAVLSQIKLPDIVTALSTPPRVPTWRRWLSRLKGIP